MTTRFLLFIVFFAGLGIGWTGNAWFQTVPSSPASSIADDVESTPPRRSADPTFEGSTSDTTQAANAQNNAALQPPVELPTSLAAASVFDAFKNLLSERLYQDAISLYQEQDKQNSIVVPRLKRSLLSELELLTKAQRYDDFSALIDQFLTVYYDDVEVLLILADFKHANGNYLEVVDVYLLARTYAYNDQDHQKVLNRFNAFAEDIDRWYTRQEDWLSLISFYSHINTAGLMTSTHQFRLAIAHLQNGEKDFAVTQLNLLLGDSVVGRAAAQALDNLETPSSAPVIDNSLTPDYTDSIALQQIGNQYAVTLTDNRQQNINLLIDTGASMTAMTSASFHARGISAEAVEQGRRVFRTAGGVVMGTVYNVAELRLGSYQLKNTQIAVIDFPTHREIDGLLGMNILGQFRFQIDQENSRLKLSKQ